MKGGKSGGGSFEIEISNNVLVSISSFGGKSGGGSFEIEICHHMSY